MTAPIIPDLDTLLRIPLVDPDGGIDVSPDSQRAACACNRSGQWEIYQVGLRQPEQLQQISSGPGAKSAPHYSPDGRWLAYVIDPDGSESYQIALFDFASQAQRLLDAGLAGDLQPNLSWSPDSRALVLISNARGYFNTYTLPIHGGAARLRLDQPRPDWLARWSPDGRTLLVVSEMEGQDYGVFLVPLAGGDPKRIELAGKALDAAEARWSPDGSCIAFSSQARQGFREVGIYRLKTAEIEWISLAGANLEAPCWSPDGRSVVCAWRHGATSRLVVVELATRCTRFYSAGRGVHANPRFTPDGRNLLFTFENPAQPCDLWAVCLGDGSTRPLTRCLPEGLRSGRFALPREIQYPGFDGAAIPALLYRPAQSESLPPAVVWVHGGPNWHAQALWEPFIQALTGQGWVVLAPNYRGSSGYGWDWQIANRFDLGGIDTRDVTAGADYLARGGLADPRRIAVTGASHGGYLTMTCLTQFPERWAGGSAVVPFLNWFSAHENAREDLRHWDIENLGDPLENRALWVERSPYFFLDRIQSPVQLICGAHDIRCPASESIAACEALAALGKAVELTLYPDEGHHFLNLENRIEAENRRLDFLRRVFQARAATPGSITT